MTMREKMARAIYENVDVGSIRGEIAVGRAVDACLDALMEPTPAMCDAVPGHAQLGNVSHVWDAMVQAAKEGK